MKLIIRLLNLMAITSMLLVSCQKNNNDDNDEGRPYEFGFTIDGQQHRHEKKDTNGIIQGEFGFITADGIYHVTVYATDENGNFKILSMRNVRISAPLDGSPLPPGAKIESLPGVAAPQPPQISGASLPPPKIPPLATVTNLQPPQLPANPRPLPLSYQNQVNQQDVAATTARPNGPYAFTTQPTIKPACGGCGYVTTAKPKSGEPKFEFQTPEFREKPTNQQNYPGTVNGNNQLGTNPSGGSVNYPARANPSTFGLSNSGAPINPSIDGLSDRVGATQGSTNGPVNPPNRVNVGGYNQGFVPNTNSEIAPNPLRIDSPPSKQPDDSPPSRLSQVTVSDGAIHVPGQEDIPIRDKFPGMVDGLPNGIQEKDITDLLYKFHYEVGFHGHYEKGTKSGAKIGGYFVNGRDGVSRIVTYVADENGFQPKVRFVRLGLESPDTPKPDSEKTFGLKSFEFIWYPVD